jgi:hypothetical protein
MNSIVIVTALGVVNFAHRMFLLPANPMGFDSWGHLYFAMEVKKQRSGPFRPLYPRVAGGEAFYYPLFVHWLYGFLPRSLLRGHITLINPTIESLFLMAALALAGAAGLPSELILAAGALYILTPLWFSKLAIGPRVLAFTPRLASEVAYPLALAIVLFDFGLSPAVAVPSAALLLAVILLGSKFGVQVVFFVTPLAAALAQSWQLALAGLIGLLVAWIGSGGAFGKQLRQQAAHLAWYFGELRHGRMYVSGRNKLSQLLPTSSKLTAAEARKLVFRWFGYNSFTAVILKAPHLPLTAILAIAYRGALDVPQALWAPVIAATIVYFLINLPWLLFLGEAERYLSHVSIHSNLLFAIVCFETGWVALAWLAAAYGLAFTLAERILLRKPAEAKAEEDARSVIDHLRNREDHRIVLSFPYGAVTPFRILLDTDHHAVFPLFAGKQHKEAMKAFDSDLALDLRQLDEMVRIAGVDFLIIDEAARREQLPDWQPPAGWRRIDGDFGDLMLYERVV